MGNEKNAFGVTHGHGNTSSLHFLVSFCHDAVGSLDD